MKVVVMINNLSLFTAILNAPININDPVPVNQVKYFYGGCKDLGMKTNLLSFVNNTELEYR